MLTAAERVPTRFRPEVIAVAAALLGSAFLLTVPSSLASFTLIDPLVDPALSRIDFGTAGDITEDCFYLTREANGTVSANDLRLVVGAGCSGKAVGSLVTGADGDFGQAAMNRVYTVAYYDWNNNARYDSGDSVLLGNNADAGSLVQGSNNTEWWIRLTPASGKPAGTLVFAGDPDLISMGSGQLLSGAEFAYADLNSNAQFDGGDRGYMASRAVSTGDAVPLFSVRLHPANLFGTQVKTGDTDLTIVLTDPEPDMTLARVDFGTAGDVTDDCFYLHNGNGSSIRIHDVRIVVGSGCSGKSLGSLVTDVDTTEKGQAAIVDPYTVAYYDVNSNANFDLGDALLVGNDANAGSLVQGSNNTEWWIRLTPSMGKAAGTLLFLGDPDFAAFGAGQVAVGAEAAFVDNDNSALFSPSDWLYMTARAIVTGDPVPFASVRIVRHPGEFGTQEGASNATTPTTSATTGGPTTSPVTTTTSPPLPRPIVEILKPSEGDTVRHVVTVSGTVDAAPGEDLDVYVQVFANGTGSGFQSFHDALAAPGEWSVAWDTRVGPDGPYRIVAHACYSSAFGPCSFQEAVGVRVRNVEVQVDHGIVGCAAHVGPVVVDDLCNGITEFEHTVHPHLASVNLTLAWKGLTPLDIHDLRLTLSVGNRTFTAEGSSNLTLSAADLDVTEVGRAAMQISIAKAGIGPDVALDEEFTLTSVWSYK